jgi:hypothetical protein
MFGNGTPLLQMLANAATVVAEDFRIGFANGQSQRPGMRVGQQVLFAPLTALPLAGQLVGELAGGLHML